MLRKTLFGIIGVIVATTLLSCGPHSSFHKIYPGVSKPKPPTAEIPIINDPPGKPYQLLGIVTAVGTETQGIISMGNSKSETAAELLVEARKAGADAVVLPVSATTAPSYSVSGGYVTKRRHHIVKAYAIRWQQDGDATVIPGDTTVESIMDVAEEKVAGDQGMITRKALDRIQKGTTTKADIRRMFGNPLSSTLSDTGFYMDIETYSISVYDMLEGSKNIAVSFNYNRDGKLSGKTIVDF